MTTRAGFEATIDEILRRELPESLDEIPWPTLPALCWRDDADVEPRLVRGWVTSAVLLGEPVPSADLFAQADLFERPGLPGLAVWLLETWFDLGRPDRGLGDARRRTLRELAERGAELALKMGRGGTDPEARYRQLLEQERSGPAPTRRPFRGLLALMAACGDTSLLASAETRRSELPPDSGDLSDLRRALDAMKS